MTESDNRPGQESFTEFSLLDALIVLLKHKKMIFFLVVISVLAGMTLLYYWNQKNTNFSVSDAVFSSAGGVYYSECLIESEPQVLERVNWLISRKSFILQMIKENNLEPDIRRAIQSDGKEQIAVGETAPTPDVYQWVRSNLFTTVSETVLTIGCAAPSEDLPPKMVSGFLSSISEHLRKLDVDRITARKNDLNFALAEARDPFLKARISDEIIKLLENESRIRSEKYYRFLLLDPPQLAEKVRILRQGKERKLELVKDGMSSSSRSSIGSAGSARRPNYVMVFLLLLLASLVVAVSLAFFLEIIEKCRQRNPEKVELLKRYASFRHK